VSDRGVDLCWWSATELAAALAARAVSPVEVARAHLDRIAAVDPGIGAFVHVDPDRVLAEAGRVAARLMSDGPGGPLDGVPYAVKDLDDVAGSPTSYGVPFLVDNIAGSSSVVAQRLAAAGGVFLGKTNTPELGYRATCRNHAFPPTHNPWRRGMTPGGSSGGSAAAVAAGLTPLADGSDGAGSIRAPAALCGVVGFKPSFGRVPVELGFDQGLVHHGPLTRTVADAALMFSVVEGAHPADPRSLPACGIDPVADLAPDPAWDRAPLRVAWCPGLPGFDVAADVVREASAAAVALGEGLGARVVESTPPLGDLLEVMWVLWQGFYGRFAPLIPAGTDEQIDADLFEVLGGGAALDAGARNAAEGAREAMWHQLVAWFEDVDVLVLPTLGLTAFPLERDHPPSLEGAPLRDRILAWLMTYPFNLAAPCPVVSVPCGLGDDGLPVGLSIVGRPWDDIGVLRVAAAVERIRPWAHLRPSCDPADPPGADGTGGAG
jgi:aspartyl-tRNA(Asn)/glutamyl-tRNA(Gln) amidotransferase subunit A